MAALTFHTADVYDYRMSGKSHGTLGVIESTKPCVFSVFLSSNVPSCLCVDATRDAYTHYSIRDSR